MAAGTSISTPTKPLKTILIVLAVGLVLVVAFGLYKFWSPFNSCDQALMNQVNSDVIRGFDPQVSLSDKPALVGSTAGNTLQEELGGLQNQDHPVGDEFNFSNSNNPQADQAAALRAYFVSYRRQITEKPVFVSCRTKSSRILFGEGTNDVSAYFSYKLRTQNGTTSNLQVRAYQPYPYQKSDWAIGSMTVGQGKIPTY